MADIRTRCVLKDGTEIEGVFLDSTHGLITGLGYIFLKDMEVKFPSGKITSMKYGSFCADKILCVSDDEGEERERLVRANHDGKLPTEFETEIGVNLQHLKNN